jgi:beta-glucosidase
MGLHDLIETPSGRLDRRRNPVADSFQRHASEAGVTRRAAAPA